MNVEKLIDELRERLCECEDNYEIHATVGDPVLVGIYAAKCNQWSQALDIVKRHAEEASHE